MTSLVGVPYCLERAVQLNECYKLEVGGRRSRQVLFGLGRSTVYGLSIATSIINASMIGQRPVSARLFREAAAGMGDCSLQRPEASVSFH